MFVEMSLQAWEKLKKRLEEKGITSYTVSDCTMKNDHTQYVHIDFGVLSKETIKNIAKDLDVSYEELAQESKENLGGVTEVRKRKWDESYHMPGTEAMGFLTGANTEEEVTYQEQEK